MNRYTPVYPPFQTEPTAVDIKIDASLKAYMDEAMPLETDEEMQRRAKILVEVEHIFLKFVRKVATDILHLPEDEARAAGGALFVSGSHKLGVRDKGADIDTVCVAPYFCTRDHFFSLLRDDIVSHSSVTEFNAVEGAIVPLMSFDFEGVSIDLQFARLSDNVVPDDLDILDDNILMGLDDTTVRTLNGPRVTQMLAEIVGTKAYPNFLIVLRYVRRWAKARGLYGNMFGYLGGVNCNILVAFICQLYPKGSPSILLERFFRVYSGWKWPKPVMLNQIQPNPANMHRDVWSAAENPSHFMPIITPAYPAANSSYSVSAHTLAVMQGEFSRAYNVIKSIIADRKSSDGDSALVVEWGKLFEPSDFFLRYSHYLQCNIVGTGADPDSRSWIGYVESRLNRFIPWFLYRMPFKHPIHFYPVKSKTNESANSVCYFIGFDIDFSLAVKGEKVIHIDDAAFKFRLSLLDPLRGYKGVMKEGLDFFVEHFPWKRLPRSVFESLGGREIAKTRRAALLLASGTNSAMTSDVDGNAAGSGDTISTSSSAEAVGGDTAEPGTGVDNSLVEKTGVGNRKRTRSMSVAGEAQSATAAAVDLALSSETVSFTNAPKEIELKVLKVLSDDVGKNRTKQMKSASVKIASVTWITLEK